jgi:hypothetical protein
MKIKIFEPSMTEPEKEITLRLVARGGGHHGGTDMGVSLVACDRDGNIVTGGYILCITAEGTLKRCPGISKKLGLQLTPDGKIKEDR